MATSGLELNPPGAGDKKHHHVQPGWQAEGGWAGEQLGRWAASLGWSPRAGESEFLSLRDKPEYVKFSRCFYREVRISGPSGGRG